MFEELGITEEEFEKFINAFQKIAKESIKDGQIIITDDEMFLALAKLPISTSKLKSFASKIRVKAVDHATKMLREILIKRLPENNSDFIEQLHESDDEAFIKILQLVKSEIFAPFLDKVNKERRNIPIEKIASLFNPEVKRYLCLATASILAGVPNAANANIEMALIKLFELFKAYEIADKLIHIEGGNERASITSKKANKIRHSKTNKIREHAIKLYEEGRFKSVRNASQILAPQIMDYAENSDELKNMEGADKKFTCSFQTADTIQRWIGKHNKEKKALSDKL